MKRLIFCITALVLLVVPILSYSAGTFTGTSTPYYNRATGKVEGFIVHLVCTANDPATTISSSIDTISGVNTYSLAGTNLHNVKSYPGATAPTDASDLTITDSYGVDLLGGKGTNLIDSTDYTQTLVGPSGAYAPQRSIGTKSVTITNNAVANAVINLILDFTVN